MILANLREAIHEAFSFLAPVQTILPLAKMRAVVFGCLSLMMTAANLLGLYSAFLAWRAICLRFKGQLRFTVETMFCSLGIVIFLSSKLFLLEMLSPLIPREIFEFWSTDLSKYESMCFFLLIFYFFYDCIIKKINF